MNEAKQYSEKVRADLDLHVDENNLINEWKTQASLMLDYGIDLADVMQEEDETKAALAVVAAEVESDIRSDPDKYQLPKVTESAISAAVPQQDAYQEAMRVHNMARHRVRVLRAVVDAVAHRKSTLQGMTELWLRQYYADPKSSAQPAELRTAAEGPPMAQITGRRVRRRTND